MREVEKRYAQDIVVRSQELGNAEQSRALLIAAAVAGLLLIVLLITTGVARSLVRPLQRLRREALEVAGERLPAYVQQVRESRDGELLAEVPSIGVTSRDEIGEVARAFDEVHREAVRLAGDEARLRNTVNAMFVNLSRRSQTLVERQLTLVERLERGERDDQRLADLFKLDHLATRMRRNSENLLVLAGQEVARRWRQPVELMDVVRASLSEVENYERVVTRVHSEVAVTGPAVSDVVHLLAELVENAVSFSSRDNKVVVSSSRDRRRRCDDLGGRPGHRHDARRDLPGELAPGQPPDRRRLGRPPHGAVRGRPPRAQTRHPRSAPAPRKPA